VLVDFVGKLGVNPAHEVLRHADHFVKHPDEGLRSTAMIDEQDRTWLRARMGYFIGAYLVQKHSGCWYVNDIKGSRYFGRYVVGRFARLGNSTPMLLTSRYSPHDMAVLMTVYERPFAPSPMWDLAFRPDST
jgi:hypothetical protein